MIRTLKLRVVKYIFFLKEIVYKAIFKKVFFGKNIIFHGKPIITMVPHSNILIEDNVVLCSNAKNTALGTNHPVILRTLKQNASLTIGSDTGISGATICTATSVKIGKGCLLGANVVIMDTDFHPIKSLNRRYDKENIPTAKIDIKDNVFIGYNSIILKGVTIGKNSVVAAGSTVVNNVPENVIVAGNPAVIIKEL